MSGGGSRSAALAYRHTQIGWGALAGVLPTLIVGLVLVGADLGIGYVVLAAAPVMVLVFGWLTVSVTDDELCARFGVGLIRKRFPLTNIQSCQDVRNPWFYGWGFRRIPEGWLYNVSGLSAVDFQLRDHQRIRIGTDEPEALLSAVAERVAKHQKREA